MMAHRTPKILHLFLLISQRNVRIFYHRTVFGGISPLFVYIDVIVRDAWTETHQYYG